MQDAFFAHETWYSSPIAELLFPSAKLQNTSNHYFAPISLVWNQKANINNAENISLVDKYPPALVDSPPFLDLAIDKIALIDTPTESGIWIFVSCAFQPSFVFGQSKKQSPTYVFFHIQ